MGVMEPVLHCWGKRPEVKEAENISESGRAKEVLHFWRKNDGFFSGPRENLGESLCRWRSTIGGERSIVSIRMLV